MNLKRFDGVVVSHLNYTQKVPGSNPGRTLLLTLLTVTFTTRFYFYDTTNDGHDGPAGTMLQWLLVGALLSLAILSPCAASLGERAFPTLSSSALADLANMRDASKNLDTSDPYSHLQKILIPRPGTYTVCAWVCKPIDRAYSRH